MFMHRITLRNILSFGPDAHELSLEPLNVFIGPNGSGKSNLLDVIRLLQAAPNDLAAPIRGSGGVADWIWGGEPKARSARVDVVVANPAGPQSLRYGFEFTEQGQSFLMLNERLGEEAPASGGATPGTCFEAIRKTSRYIAGRPTTSEASCRESTSRARSPFWPC
jgi:predicted ATPase